MRDEQRTTTSEDRATQLLICEALSLAIWTKVKCEDHVNYLVKISSGLYPGKIQRGHVLIFHDKTFNPNIFKRPKVISEKISNKKKSNFATKLVGEE